MLAKQLLYGMQEQLVIVFDYISSILSDYKRLIILEDMAVSEQDSVLKTVVASFKVI